MKKIAVLLTAMALAAFTFVACGGAETPGTITEKVYTSLESGDYDYVIDKIATNGETLSTEDREKLKKMFEMSKGQLDAKEGIKSVTIIKETISEDGNSCTVEAEVEYGNGEKEPANSNFIKENDEWKISVGQ